MWRIDCAQFNVKPDDWIPIKRVDEGADLIFLDGDNVSKSWNLSKFELRYDLGYKNKKRAV